MLDSHTFETYFRSYFRSLCKYLSLYTDDFGLIEDCVQSVFVKLWEDRNKVTIESVKTYLFVSARNKLLNEIRNRNKRTELLENFFLNEMIHSEAEDVVNFDEFCEVVVKAVESLPEKTREVYKLSREENLSYKDISQIRNISVNTVENHMSKALKRLSQALKEYYKIILIFIFFHFY